MKLAPITIKGLIHNNLYFIESYGPNGLIENMTGVYKDDVKPLLRFDEVTYCNRTSTKRIGIIHKPEDISKENNFYWKYYEFQ